MNTGFLERPFQDFKNGVRLLRLNPGFAATAILSLALGIAANTSIFTLLDQEILRFLPVDNPRELVQFRMEGGRAAGVVRAGMAGVAHLSGARAEIRVGRTMNGLNKMP